MGGVSTVGDYKAQYIIMVKKCNSGFGSRAQELIKSYTARQGQKQVGKFISGATADGLDTQCWRRVVVVMVVVVKAEAK